MAKKKSIAEKAGEFELNLTPMIDAVFLLLIFFMTTTVFVKSTQLKIELPDASHLAGYLEREKVRSGSSTLIITADAEAEHGHIIDAMEMATVAGIEKIDIETEEPAN